MNIKSLSEEQLLESIAKCRRALNSMPNNQSYTDSIWTIIESYENEYQERIFMNKMNEDLEKNPTGTIEIGSVEDIEDNTQ
jgi:hypothetical protein